MANNLRKFDTYAEYSAATLVKPAVSLIEETDGVIFDPKDEAPMLGDIRLTFNISDTVNETLIYNTGGASEGGEEASEGGEDSEGSGGSFVPSAMWVDGVSVTPINSYRFLTAGLHTVDLELSDGEMPENLLGYVEMVKVEIGNGVTNIVADACSYCYSLTSCTIGSGVTNIGTSAFASNTALTSVTIYATTPPTLGFTVFHNSTCPIYVPSASVNAYKAATNWSDYSSRIQAI